MAVQRDEVGADAFGGGDLVEHVHHPGIVGEGRLDRLPRLGGGDETVANSLIVESSGHGEHESTLSVL